MSRRNIWIDDALHTLIAKAAADEGSRKGKPMSVAEWIREACRQRLEREGTDPRDGVVT